MPTDMASPKEAIPHLTHSRYLESAISMKASPSSSPAEGISPAVHLEFIQNQVGLPENASLEEIEAYHRALFLHQHARELEQYSQEEQAHEAKLAHLDVRLTAAHAKLAGMESLLPTTMGGQPDIAPSAPWNAWDRTMFVAAILGILGLLVFGVLNVSFNLLESGLVTFTTNPVRAYFWAALLPVGALAVKVGWDLLPGRMLRGIYLWVCLALGLAGVLTWLAAYSVVYPRLSQSTQEQLESVSVFDTAGRDALGSATGAGSHWIDTTTVVSQCIAEIFLSAVLGMYLTTLYLRHRPVRLVGNPLFTQLDEERRSLEQRVAQTRRDLAEAKGNQCRLENQLTALLLFARSLFRKEARLHQDQVRHERLLLDQISEQLRNQLEGVDKNRAVLRGINPAPEEPAHRNGQ